MLLSPLHPRNVTLSSQSPVVDSQKLSCCKHLDLGVTTVASVASLPFEDFVPTCPPQSTPVQCVMNSCTSKLEARDSGDQDFGDTSLSGVTEQVIVLETENKPNKKRRRIPEKVNYTPAFQCIFVSISF